MLTEIRGGAPIIRTVTATSGAPVTIYPPVATKFAQVFNGGADPVNMWFDTADQAAGANALQLAASGSAGDTWEGPAEFVPHPVSSPRGEGTRGGITFQSTGADATMTVVYYQRRG